MKAENFDRAREIMKDIERFEFLIKSLDQDDMNIVIYTKGMRHVHDIVNTEYINEILAREASDIMNIIDSLYTELEGL